MYCTEENYYAYLGYVKKTCEIFSLRFCLSVRHFLSVRLILPVEQYSVVVVCREKWDRDFFLIMNEEKRRKYKAKRKRQKKKRKEKKKEEARQARTAEGEYNKRRSASRKHVPLTKENLWSALKKKELLKGLCRERIQRSNRKQNWDAFLAYLCRPWTQTPQKGQV